MTSHRRPYSNHVHQLTTYWQSGGMILLAVGVGKLISFLWKLLLARSGPQALGTVELALTVFTIVSSFALLGFHTALLRFVSVNSKNAKRSFALVSFTLRIVVAFGCLIVALFLSKPEILARVLRSSIQELEFIQNYLWIAPLFAISELLWTYFAATKHILLYSSVKYILHPALRLFALIVGLALGIQLRILLLPHLAIAAVGTVTISLWRALRFGSFFGQSLSLKQAREFLSFSAPMSASFLTFAVYGALDVILLARHWGTEYIGLFAALVVLSDIPDMVLIPLLNILQAYLSDSYTNVQRGLRFVVTNMRLFFGVALVLSLTVYLIRRPLIVYLFGEQYEGIAGFLGWFLIVKIIQSTAVLPLRHFLDFYGHVRLTFFLMILSLGIKFAVGVSTVAAFGLTGIVAAQLSGVAVHLVGCAATTWWVVQKDNKQRTQIRGV